MADFWALFACFGVQILNASYEWISETGCVREINQDSLLYIEAEKQGRRIILALIADGMGGEKYGELASKTVVQHLSDWFERLLCGRHIRYRKIKRELARQIKLINQEIYEYGKGHSIRLGTTVSAIVILPDRRYVIAHVGDSRIYLKDKKLYQLTADMSYVGQLVRKGEMSERQARSDPRRNILLECVGITEKVEVQMVAGKLASYAEILICSDGLWHELEAGELMGDGGLREKARICMARGEDDNISAIYIRIDD